MYLKNSSIRNEKGDIKRPKRDVAELTDLQVIYVDIWVNCLSTLVQDLRSSRSLDVLTGVLTYCNVKRFRVCSRNVRPLSGNRPTSWFGPGRWDVLLSSFLSNHTLGTIMNPSLNVLFCVRTGTLLYMRRGLFGTRPQLKPSDRQTCPRRLSRLTGHYSDTSSHQFSGPKPHSSSFGSQVKGKRESKEGTHK